MALALVTRLRPPREAALGTRLVAGVAALTVLLAAIVLIALSTGPLDIPVTHVVAIIVEPTGIHLTDYDRTEELVVEQIRMPRIVVGALVGMALGVAGAAMQALFRNPLADPGTIGVASGGAAAAVIAIATGASTLFFLECQYTRFPDSLRELEAQGYECALHSESKPMPLCVSIHQFSRSVERAYARRLRRQRSRIDQNHLKFP